MSRSQFVETVVEPYGTSHALIPVDGVAVVVYHVNDDGSEGDVADTYLNRTDSTAGPSSTDASGTIAFYLEPGDYNIHFDDPREVPRIDSFVRGFAAVTSRSVDLAHFQAGDLKLSIATEDHGDSTGAEAYDWLRADGGLDGDGRMVSAELYPKLWVAMGAPALDGEGNFRLPNPSARALIAAGSATGLTTRSLLDTDGTEKDSRQFVIPDVVISHAGIAVTGTIHLVQHAHGLSYLGYAHIGYEVDGSGPGATVLLGELVLGSPFLFNAGQLTFHSVNVDYSETTHAFRPATLGGSTDLSFSEETPMSLNDGVTGEISIDTSSRGDGDWKTNAQDIDKMQPWIAFTVFIRAT